MLKSMNALMNFEDLSSMLSTNSVERVTTRAIELLVMASYV